MACTTHWSHIEKVAAIAVSLAQLSYPITFITGRTFENHISNLHPNIKYAPILGPNDKMSDDDTKTYMSIPPGPEQELFIMKKVLAENNPYLKESVEVEFKKFKEQYGDDKPLIFLYDVTFTGSYPVQLGAPGIKPDANVGIGISPLAIESNDTFPFRSGKVPHPGPDSKEVHFKAWQEFNAEWFNKELNGAWWAKLRELGVTQEKLPAILHAFHALPEHLLLMGIPEFEFPRSDFRKDIRYFGAFKKVGDQGDSKPQLPAWWDDIEKAKREGKKIIAVSQGTVEANPKDLTLPTLEALKDRDDVLIIATTVISEPEDIPNLVVPKNARIAKFVPYDLLLPTVDLLISNGGYGAVQHALRLGIPMVVSGIGQDKPTTNSLVEWSGVGINLKVRQPGAKIIGEAVKVALEDEDYRKKARDLSKKYEKYEMGEVADGLVRDLVWEWVEGRRRDGGNGEV
ncbi:glycosyltransferase family 1 protein [Zopfia rhizophila CBS 207.26]|uniref:Glycosyltransferase family 1 protein n=1 Tax=Zopfia rhizophila CBS 207.26 TaxID=1314779 RepID=A0A6A6EIS7_9PEZI|nr:glycosyltransferase family 1 protein [Zopfia rhizophila CBS 207.26]